MIQGEHAHGWDRMATGADNGFLSHRRYKVEALEAQCKSLTGYSNGR